MNTQMRQKKKKKSKRRGSPGRKHQEVKSAKQQRVTDNDRDREI